MFHEWMYVRLQNHAGDVEEWKSMCDDLNEEHAKAEVVGDFVDPQHNAAVDRGELTPKLATSTMYAKTEKAPDFDNTRTLPRLPSWERSNANVNVRERRRSITSAAVSWFTSSKVNVMEEVPDFKTMGETYIAGGADSTVSERSKSDSFTAKVLAEIETEEAQSVIGTFKKTQARARLSAMRKDRSASDSELREHAAAILQCIWRSNKSRIQTNLLNAKLRRHHSAKRLQRFFRMIRVKKLMLREALGLSIPTLSADSSSRSDPSLVFGSLNNSLDVPSPRTGGSPNVSSKSISRSPKLSSVFEVLSDSVSGILTPRSYSPSSSRPGSSNSNASKIESPSVRMPVSMEQAITGLMMASPDDGWEEATKTKKKRKSFALASKSH